MAINNEPHIHQLVICTNIFIHRNGNYLMLRRSPKKRWAASVVHPVGGKVDHGEDLIASARREVLSETGVTVKNLRLLAVIQEIEPVKAEPGNWLIFHFAADYDSGELTGTEEGELVWLTAEQIKQEKLFPSVSALIDRLLKPDQSPIFASFGYLSDTEIDPKTAIINVTATS